jgi:hypothetical protein
MHAQGFEAGHTADGNVGPEGYKAHIQRALERTMKFVRSSPGGFQILGMLVR